MTLLLLTAAAYVW